MMRNAFIAALLASALVTTAASAQDYVGPKYGTVFEYEGVNWKGPRAAESEGTKATGLHLVVRSAKDQVSTRFRLPEGFMELRNYRGVFSFEFHYLDIIRRSEFDESRLRALWPLEVGRTVEFSGTLQTAPGRHPRDVTGKPNVFRATGGTFIARFAVERRESLATDAGTFEAVIIARHLEDRDEHGKAIGRDSAKIWYAPSIGWWIRIEGHSDRPDPNTGEMRTVSSSMSVLKRIVPPR